MPNRRTGGEETRGGRHQRLLDLTSEAILLLDPAGTVLEANRKAGEYLGSSPREMAGREYFSIYPDEVARARRAIFQEAVKSAETVEMEEEREGRWTSQRMVPLVDGAGNVDAVAVLVRDITAEKKAEGRVRDQERQVARAARMVSLGTLVSGVAHEINNPTNFIMMNAPLLQDVWRSAEPLLEEYFDSHGDFVLGGLPFSEMRGNVPTLFSGVTEGARRINRIVSSLKDFARQERSDVIEEVDLNAVVESAVGLLGHFTRRSTDRFSVNFGSPLPKVEGNGQKLEQVVINLVQNACQSLPSRDRSVTVSTGSDEEREAVVLTVSDEGQGIPESDLPSIMDPFFTTRRKEGGTGLGLSITANIVKEHGGDIRVWSREGEGTTFEVTLPQRTELPRTRVLVVDDEESLRKLMIRTLSRNRVYRVREASNGIEACIKLGTFRPRLLVLDINMPEMDGREVCRWVRSEPALSETKVIVVTGYPDSTALREIRDMGFRNVLMKPFLPTSFLELVTEVLSG